MKFLAFIMAFLVLILSMLPCADTDFVSNKARNELIKSDHSQNNTQRDDCSPFCTCTCCAGFSINHVTASVSSLILFSVKPISNFLFSESIDIPFSFWQPPRKC